MRNFNWETLPKNRVMGKRNIWTVDKTDGEYELDTDRMEELFSHTQQRRLNAANRQSLKGTPAAATEGGMVSILSSKRSMNIGIFLKQFKRPLKDMIDDIVAARGHSFGCGKLQELCKLLPEDGEIKQLVGFKGDKSALPDADLFMLMLVQTSSYEERLNCLVLKEEFFPLMNEMKELIETLSTAGRELLESDHLHSVIRLVLKTGNYMNAGGYAGSAVGFRMSSLLKLADTKANNPGMNLMHYVVMQAQKADVALLEFSEQLQHVEAGARINKSDIEAEFKRQVKKVEDATADTLKQEDLKAQMEDFLKEAEVWLAETETELQEMQSVSDSVAEYFCEDPQKFKLEECCSIFNSFCERFMRAMQENKAREMAEVKRRQRDRLQNAAKRRSTATCSSRDKEMEGIALESVLQRFLTKRNSRTRSGGPSSTHGSPRSGSPCTGTPLNGSLTEITSQTNLPSESQKGGEAFSGKEISRKEWNSAFELTQTSSKEKPQSNIEDCNEKGDITIQNEEVKTASKESDSKGFTTPTERTTDIPPTVRSYLSTTSDDGEEDPQDNTEEEAAKLREASKKVLRFQRNRSSASSGEFALENRKSPGPSSNLPRQHTFDEATKRSIEDPKEDDLVRLLLDPQATSKRNLCRRHTLPSKVPKTEEDEDDLWTQLPIRSPKPAPQEKRTSTGDDASSKSGSGFSDVALDPEKQPPQNQKSPPPTREKSARSDEGFPEPGRQDNSTEPSDKHKQMSSENIPPRGTWLKTESPGLFFNFFKRLGDLSKQQTSPETVQKGTGV